MATKISKFLTSCGSLVVTRSILSSGLRSHTQRLHELPRRMASTGSDTVEQAVVAVKQQVEAPLDSSSSVNEAVVPENNGAPVSSSNNTSNISSSETTERKPGVLRVPKMKAAIVLSYCGQGYYGMQIQNNGTRTIENDLMKAFLDAGVVDEEGFQKPKSVKFQRAARTDKNVSAARQIVSMMVPKTFDVDSVNKYLPEQIRLMDFRKVTKGFDAKVACNCRTYMYMIPTFAFTPLEQTVQEDYRISSEVLGTLRETLKLYHGTKNFHNFTSRKKPTDPSAFRFIMDFSTSEPFVKDGLEYVVLKVKGQSFMLHQIRKMIGLVVAMLRGFASTETMKKSFTLDRIDLPMAPGLGLMLGEAHYDHYNKRYGSDGIHESLIWDNVADKIEEFCQEKIYPIVTRTENEEKSMMQWLSTVPYHSYDVRDEEVKHKGGFGPLGKANLLVKKESGEDSGDEVDVDDEADDEGDTEIPNKKRKRN